MLAHAPVFMVTEMSGKVGMVYSSMTLAANGNAKASVKALMNASRRSWPLEILTRLASAKLNEICSRNWALCFAYACSFRYHMSDRNFFY